MAEWQPYRESLRVTLARTVGIALLAAGVVAPWFGGIRRWPVLSLLMLWPAFGGHWVDVMFLNFLRPRLPDDRIVQGIARVVVWFAGGIVLGLGVRLTARALLARPGTLGLTWAIAGVGFVAVELIAHGALHVRGRPSFFNGLG